MVTVYCGNDVHWGGWTSSTTSTISYNDTWTNWTTSVPYTTTGNSVYVWVYWTSDSEYSYKTVVNYEETEEEKLARLERQKNAELERQQLAEEHRKKKQEAEANAIELLEDLLTPEEAILYRKTGRVLIRGRMYDYLVSKDTGHVRRIEKDKVVDLCMHIQDRQLYLAPTDNVVAMKLYIEGREEEFNREANNHGRWSLKQEEKDFLEAVGM